MSRRRIVAVGLTLAAPVLLLTACGSSSASSPPSGEASSCVKQGAAGSYSIDLTLAPCPVKAGTTASALVVVRDGAGKAVDNATVKLTADMPTMKMNGDPENASYTGTDYQGRILLGMSGPWKLKVQVQPGSGPSSEATFDVDAT